MENFDLNKNLQDETGLALPENILKIVQLINYRFPNIPQKIILNCLIYKLAQMLTAKRVTCDESGKINMPNWYALIFSQSGGGKDRIVNYLDRYICKDFIKWYKAKSAEIYKEQMKEYLSNEEDDNSFINNVEMTKDIFKRIEGENNGKGFNLF